MPGNVKSRGKKNRKRKATSGSAPEAPRIAAKSASSDALLQTLHERDERIAFVIDAADLGTWDWDLETNNLAWSARCRELYGLPSGTPITYDTFLRAVHPDDRERVDTAVKEAIAQRRDYDAEMRSVWPDGSVHWISSRGHAYYNNSGKPVRMAGVVLDITEGKKVQQALAEAHARTKRVLTSIMEGYYCVDSDWRIVEMNPVAEQHFGRRLADVAGKVLWDLTHSSPQSAIKRHFDAAMKSRQPTRFDVESEIRPGFWSRIYLYPRDGGLDVYFHDITEHKHAELDRLRLASQRQLALDAAKLGWWHYDPITKIASYDEGYKKIFQVTGHRKPNEEILKRLHPDDLPQVWARVEAALNPLDPQPYEAQYRILRDDGSFRWIEAHGVATFEGEGDQRHATSLVGTVADITERKLADSRLRRFFETDLFALLYWQIDGGVLAANDKFLELTGYSREDLHAGRLNWARITPPEFQAADEDARRQVRETGVHRPYEKQYIRKDGKRIWIQVSAAAWEDNRNEGVSFILDITERKQAELALRESESKFRSLFSNSLDAIMVTDGEGAITAANPAACALFGMTEEEICARGRDGLVDPTESRLKSLVNRRKTEGKATGDLVHRRKDGTRFIAETTSVNFPGEPNRAFVVLRDITERKLAEEKLRVSEEKFAQAFSGNPAAIAVTRFSDGTFLEVNDTWTQLTGWTRPEVLGTESLKLGIWAGPDERKRFVAELRARGALRGWQPEFKKKSGESFFAEISAQILTIGGEEVVLSTLIDITERKRAEEELRLSNERFQVALRNSPVVVFNQDLDLRYTWIYNPALGYASSEVLGKRDSDLFERGEDAAVTEAIKRRVIESGVSQRREVTIYSMGLERHYDLQVEPLCDSDGLVVGVTCAAIDVTDRKRAEAAMLRSEKLASVGRMAATVAHEINNPLEAVMNAIFLAQLEKSPEAARTHLKIADEELRRVAHIARQSLGFYRDRSEPACVSATLILNSAVDLLKNKIRAKGAVIKKDWDEQVRVRVVANELRQVFGNLVANSLDALAPGGVIALRTRRYTRPDGEPGVRILIADNGAGITPDARQHLFEPLFTTKDDVGTGLGLWVSKQIVEKHGGTIRLRSRCNGSLHGTTMVINLPGCAE